MPLAESRGGASGGLGQRPNCSSSDQSKKESRQRRRQRSVPASNFFALPQKRPNPCSFNFSRILSRPLARPEHPEHQKEVAHPKSHAYPKKEIRNWGNQKSRIYYLYGAVREIRGRRTAADCRCWENPTSAKSSLINKLCNRLPRAHVPNARQNPAHQRLPAQRQLSFD